MPSLKDLNCAIELSDNQQALQEFGTIYGDGFVETFVPVPSKPQSFSVHLTSNKFIAPGVAIFVYVDGVYQCNRNRQDLKLRKPSDNRSLVDFRVRQKEERQKDGSMIAREWTFDKLNITTADDAPNLCSANILNNIGCIEVIVLRCAGTRSHKSASTMNLDGAGDSPDHHYGLDGTSSPSLERSMYDDRPPFFKNSLGSGYGPPPPISYHPPYTETVRSREAPTSQSRRSTHAPRELSPRASISRRSRYSEPISLGARQTNEVPSLGFQYGSGPIPRNGDPFQQRPPSDLAANAPGVDPVWLNNLLRTAVKQGVEESRKAETQSEGHYRHKKLSVNVETTSQPPGAWPESPFDLPTQPYRQSEPSARSIRDHESDRDTNWGQSQDGWGKHTARSRAGTRVTIAEPAWDNESSSGKGWNSREETPSDSWDTEDTWDTSKANKWEAASQPERLRVTNSSIPFNTRPSSPVTTRTGDRRRRSKHNSHRESRSKSRPSSSRRRRGMTSSSEENEDWTSVDRPSDSVVSMSSSNDTVRPSHSPSRVHASRDKSKSRSRRSKSKHRDHDRKPSRHSHNTPTGQSEVAGPPPAPPSITRAVPTVTNAPAPTHPNEVRSRKASTHIDPLMSVLPPPGWGPAVPEQIRKSSNATGFTGPAPYAQSLKDFVKSTLGVDEWGNRSTSSSSWGSDKKGGAAKSSWGEKSKKKTETSDEDNGWGEKKSEGQEESGWEVKNDDKSGGWGEKKFGGEEKSGWDVKEDDKSGGWDKTDGAKDVEANAWDTNNWDVPDGPKSEKKVDAPGGWGKTDDAKNIETSAWDTNKWDIPNSPKSEKKADAPGLWADLKNAVSNAFNNQPAPNTSPAPEIVWQDQTWNNKDTNNAPNAIQWDTTNLWTSVPTADDKKPEKPYVSRRHSNKALSKYRPASADLAPKPHWQFPPPLSSTKKLYPIAENSTYIAPKEPRLTISAKAASEKGVEHQVRAGKATEYGHAVGRPEYLDRLEKPYAVFRFKYRSKEILKALFGEEVPEVVERKHEKVKEKEKLEDLPKEELVEKMLKLQSKLEQKEGGRKESERKHKSSKHGEKERRHSEKKKERRASGQTEVVAKNLTEQWVKQHSRDPSEKGRSLAVKEEKKDKDEGWGQTGNGGWNDGDNDAGDVKW